jgi:hypothetical protein
LLGGTLIGARAAGYMEDGNVPALLWPEDALRQ